MILGVAPVIMTNEFRKIFQKQFSVWPQKAMADRPEIQGVNTPFLAGMDK